MTHAKVVDLQRIRAADEKLAAALANLSPDERAALADRTEAMLTGSIPCPDLERPAMPRPTVGAMKAVQVRLPQSLLDQADRLIPGLVGQAPFATQAGVSRSDVVRLALLRGLAELECEYPPQGSLPGTGDV